MHVSWADFDQASGLERDMLLRALPLVPTRSSDAWRMKIDLSAPDPVQAQVAMDEIVGATPEACIDLLRIRPLLFGAAWKVLDLLLEEAFSQANEVPDLSRGYSIGEKGRIARSGAGRPTKISVDVWSAITLTYDATRVLRDSLVHRRVYIDQTGSLVGLDAGGGRLAPLSAAEQEALARMTMRASEVVLGPVDSREEIDLRYQLTVLERLHKVSLSPGGLPPRIPEITVVVDPTNVGADTYMLDVQQVIGNYPFAGNAYADLIVEFRDRPGQVLRGRLEDAPQSIETIDPAQPPSWLS